MTREEALALVERLRAAVNRHATAAIMADYGDDAVAVSPVFGEVRGRDAIAATWESLFTTLPDASFELSDVLVEGDRVAMLGTVAATDRAGWFGLPPTGGAIDYRIAILCTVAHGKIVRDERVYDSSGVLERLEKARLDEELRTAAEVQRALLVRTELVATFCESVGDSLPCRAIGGDFFELIDLPRGEIGIVLGDVSGKGPPAALLAAMLQGMLAADVQLDDGPAATLARINQRLVARRLDPRFVTLVYAVLSPGGRLVYCNAGHNPPALLTGGGIRRLATGGTILGAFPTARFTEEELQLDPGDTLVMFTDGVTEARDPAGEELGDDRLLACLSASAALPPATLLRSVFDAVRDFSREADQADDITVTVTRFR